MHDPAITRWVFIAAGVVGLLFGLFFMVGAAPAIEQFGLGTPTIPALLFARSTGAVIIGLSIADLIAAFDPGSRALRALAIGNVVVHLLSIVTDFSQPYDRNAGVWVGLAVHVIFIAAFGYCIVHWREMMRMER